MTWNQHAGFYWSLSPANYGWTETHVANYIATVLANQGPSTREIYLVGQQDKHRGRHPGGKRDCLEIKMRRGRDVPWYLDPFTKTAYSLTTWRKQAHWGLIYSFSACLLNFYYVPGCVLKAGSKTKKIPALKNGPFSYSFFFTENAKEKKEGNYLLDYAKNMYTNQNQKCPKLSVPCVINYEMCPFHERILLSCSLSSTKLIQMNFP